MACLGSESKGVGGMGVLRTEARLGTYLHTATGSAHHLEMASFISAVALREE